jgi:hypothetical protein
MAEKKEISAGVDQIIVPSLEMGEACFGWQTEKYYDFWSKLNWCAIVVLTKKGLEKDETSDEKLKDEVSKPWFRANEMEHMLKSVCVKFGYDVVLTERSEDDWDFYIDHQSNIVEEPDNARMFMTEKTLADFLFNDGSYIDNSNDNGGRDDEEYDCDTGKYSSQPPDYYRKEL